MEKIEESEILFNKIQKLTTKDLNVISILKLFNIFIKIRKGKSIKHLKIFIKEYFSLKEEMSEDFYELILDKMLNDDYLNIFKIIIEGNVYSFISYLKYDKEDILELEENITPLQYYTIPKKYINLIIDNLKKLENEDDDNYLNILLKDELLWNLRRTPNFSDTEYRVIAYKIYISIGLDNGLELLTNKYGEFDYEKVYFLFSNLNIKFELNRIESQTFNDFLFNNKKDYNNITRQMLNGKFKELFLNFDYFYNNFSYFINKLGTKMSKTKVKTLLEERHLSQNVALPQITGDILEDMISSYQCKYNFLDVPEDEIHKKNFEIYEEFLRRKYKSSIPMIEFKNKDPFLCEVISLSDPRNLVLGYRSGNCFRINGDAAILFHNFLKSKHMRLISISTLENKDFAMMLVMRNGNVLIGQGIEVSKWVPSNIKGKKLYDTCRQVLKEMMEYMNSNGDEIVATIIGSSNSNVSEYNNQVLPFLINPILENSNNYYNGICNYQCLLDLSEGKSLKDIKLKTPSVRFFDKREPILRRTKNMHDEGNNYMAIEKILISLRFLRMKKEGNFNFYQKLSNHSELYTCCSKDWYITLFDDGTIDSFISDDNEIAKKEYDIELKKIQYSLLKNNIKKSFIKKYKL